MQILTAHLSRQMSLLAESRTDGELLSAFLSDRDESAFAELVRRHGPLVWGACRRLLPDPADAEDAFQAAFIVLVRRARRLREQPSIGPWLHKVATWTARNIRRRNARTKARRVPLAPDASNSNDSTATSNLQADLDGALLALPEKYRTPLILCHLQGWSRRDAAAQLGCPEGTLSSLLSRGLARLRAKLGSYDPTKLLSAAVAAVPAVLASTTVRAATASRLAAGVVPVSVSQLVEGVIHMFWMKKATAAMTAMVVIFGFGLGAGVSVKQAPMAAAGEGGSAITTAPTGWSPKVSTADLDLELQSFKDQLAATEFAIISLKAQLQLGQEKLRTMRESVYIGERSQHDLLKAMEMVRRSEQGLQDAEKKQALLIQTIKALETLKAAKGAPPEPNPAKPLPVVPGDLQKQLDDLRAQLQKNQLDTTKLAADRDRLRAAELLLLDELKKRNRDPKPAPAASTVRGLKDVILLTIGPKDAKWRFAVTEHDGNGKPVGSAQFDTAAMLGRYLTRTAKDATAPKELRVSVAGDFETARLREFLDLIGTSGLKVSMINMTAPEVRRVNPLVPSPDKSSLVPDDLRKLDATRLKLLEQYEQQLRELERLKKDSTTPPISPARP